MTDEEFELQLIDKLQNLTQDQLDGAALTEADRQHLLRLLRPVPREYAVLNEHGELSVRGGGICYDAPRALTRPQVEQIARFFGRAFAAGERRRADDIRRLINYRFGS